MTDGTWTAANGKFTVTTTVGVDTAELSVKQANNTRSTVSMTVGRGASHAVRHRTRLRTAPLAGGVVVGPNRTIGDLAGEASGRKAVRLNATGASVSAGSARAATNTHRRPVLHP